MKSSLKKVATIALINTLTHNNWSNQQVQATTITDADNADETVYDKPDQIDAVPEHDPALDPEVLVAEGEVLGEDHYEDDDLDDLDATTDELIRDALDAMSDDEVESLGDLMGIDDDDDEEEPDDYVEEIINAEGQHIRKEVHQGAGFKSVRITTDGGGPPTGDMPPEIKQMMNAMMGGPPPGLISQMLGGPAGMIGGGPPGMIRIGGPMLMPPPGLFDDDDDDDDIPAEIKAMIEMTAAMASRSQGFGGMMGAPTIRIVKKSTLPDHEKHAIASVPDDHAIKIVEQPRHEESVEDIMARMNKIGEEIGEKHENRRSYSVESKSQRLFQILIIGGIMIVLMVASFFATCKANGKSSRSEDDDDVVESPKKNTVRKAD